MTGLSSPFSCSLTGSWKANRGWMWRGAACAHEGVGGRLWAAGEAKGRQKPIPPITVNAASEADDRLRQPLQCPADSEVDLFGVNPGRRARIARQVGGEHGHQTVAFSGGRLGWERNV